MRSVLALTLLTAQLLAQTPSAPVQGPHHLSGWNTESIVEGVENQGPLPIELVLARNGRVIRRIPGSPFVWTWMFRPNGTQVAYETGPLHFSMTCILADIATGKQLAAYDCFTELPDNAPGWVEELEQKSVATPSALHAAPILSPAPFILTLCLTPVTSLGKASASSSQATPASKAAGSPSG